MLLQAATPVPYAVDPLIRLSIPVRRIDDRTIEGIVMRFHDLATSERERS